MLFTLRVRNVSGARKKLPTVGSEILTRDGAARVLGHDILSQQMMVKTEDHRRILINASDVVQVTKVGVEPKPTRRRGPDR